MGLMYKCKISSKYQRVSSSSAGATAYSLCSTMGCYSVAGTRSSVSKASSAGCYWVCSTFYSDLGSVDSCFTSYWTTYGDYYFGSGEVYYLGDGATSAGAYFFYSGFFAVVEGFVGGFLSITGLVTTGFLISGFSVVFPLFITGVLGPWVPGCLWSTLSWLLCYFFSSWLSSPSFFSCSALSGLVVFFLSPTAPLLVSCGPLVLPPVVVIGLVLISFAGLEGIWSR